MLVLLFSVIPSVILGSMLLGTRTVGDWILGFQRIVYPVMIAVIEFDELLSARTQESPARIGKKLRLVLRVIVLASVLAGLVFPPSAQVW